MGMFGVDKEKELKLVELAKNYRENILNINSIANSNSNVLRIGQSFLSKITGYEQEIDQS